ncbi:MAG: sugar phosphate nucleotidyltransferase [Thermoplasmata archaeon]
MKAVVLAGGFGERLRPLTEARPKPLITIAGKPCIDYVIRSLVKADFREIVVTTGYMSDHLIKKIGDGIDYEAGILYSFEENPAGTAGAVKKVADFLDETFIVASGDVLADVDMRELYDYHKRKGAVATMALTEVKNPSQFGIVELDDESRIVRFKEKPKKDEIFSNLVNAGIYVLEPEALEFIPEREMFDFSKNVFPALLQKGAPLYGKRLKGIWVDIGRPLDVINASLEIIEREGKEQEFENAIVKGPIMMGRNVVSEKSVRIIGPAYIGDNVFLGRGVLIERSCVYNDVFVDRGVMLLRSAVMSNSRIGWQSEIEESVLSTNSNVEEDVKISRSIIGDDMTVKAHSRIEDASLSPPKSHS